MTCDPAVQLDRLIARGATTDDANRRIAAQAGLVDRAVAVATRVIDSSGDPRETRSAVGAALEAALGRDR